MGFITMCRDLCTLNYFNVKWSLNWFEYKDRVLFMFGIQCSMFSFQSNYHPQSCQVYFMHSQSLTVQIQTKGKKSVVSADKKWCTCRRCIFSILKWSTCDWSIFICFQPKLFIFRYKFFLSMHLRNPISWRNDFLSIVRHFFPFRFSFQLMCVFIWNVTRMHGSCTSTSFGPSHICLHKTANYSGDVVRKSFQ